MKRRSWKPGATATVRSISKARQVLLAFDYETALSGGPVSSNDASSHGAAASGDAALPSASGEIPPAVLECLSRLAANPRVTLVVVSARPLAYLESRVAIDPVIFAANHGLEIRGKGLGFVEPYAFLLEPALRRVIGEMRSLLEPFRSIQIEDRWYTAAVHLNSIQEPDRARALARVLSLIHASSEFECIVNPGGLEILPRNGWRKSTALHWVKSQLGLDRALTVYAGAEEEHMLAPGLAPGIVIEVGDANGRQAYSPVSQADVWALIAQLEGALSMSSIALPHGSGH